MKFNREYTDYLQDILEAATTKIYLLCRLLLRKYSKIWKKVLIRKYESVPNFINSCTWGIPSDGRQSSTAFCNQGIS
jgi:hypothetical protein